jgi:hypothetical protein
MEELAKNAYEALRESVHGVSTVSGKPLPPWEELDASVTDAWVGAIQAVEDAVSPAPEEPEPPAP